MSAMFYGFREREEILTVFEAITGLRMNHAYIRPGGLAADLPDGGEQQVAALCKLLPGRLAELEDLLRENSIWKARTKDVGYLDLDRLYGARRDWTGAALDGSAARLTQITTLLRIRNLRLRRDHR